MRGHVVLFVDLDRHRRRNVDAQLLPDRCLRIAQQPGAESVSPVALPTILIRISLSVSMIRFSLEDDVVHVIAPRVMAP